jgi:hypothetical protein
MLLHLSLALLSAGTACATTPQDPGTEASEPVELGRVRWTHDLDAALESSKTSGKPVFALFQEVPGCSTCKRFGGGPLSHPLLVEAIEDLFVPLVVFNNRGGGDAQMLERFDEPSWNNPVVRYLDGQGKDVLPRRDRVWSTGGVATRTADALRAADRELPRWLALVVTETNASRLETATFSMACFWQGEARLGRLDGVVGTRAGWQGGREVVEVRYDPNRIDAERLKQEAERARCTAAKGEARSAGDSDRKYYLQRSPLNYLPLTPMQRTKVNAALGTNGDPEMWLSPRQAALLRRLRATMEDEPDRLRGLEPPEAIGELEAYERLLRERLTRKG